MHRVWTKKKHRSNELEGSLDDAIDSPCDRKPLNVLYALIIYGITNMDQTSLALIE
jgi:hypothetical protein